MNRGWGPDQRWGSNPWWAFGSLDLAQSTDTMHKNVTDLAQSNSTMHKSVPPHSVSFPTIIGVKVGVLCFSVSLWEKVDDAGFPTDSRYLISPPSTLHLLAQKGTGLFFCWQIITIIVFFFSHIWALLIFGIQPSEYLSHLLKVQFWEWYLW